ncbi:MAG: HIT family protein [Bacteroidales bacterium]
MKSVFAKIAQNEIPCYKIAEDELHLAFLDVNPLAIGHTLVIPKEQINYIFDLKENEFSRLFCFAQKVAKGLERAVSCKRIGITVIGLEVPHAHIHLIPLNSADDIDFKKPKLAVSNDVLINLAKNIEKEISIN